MKKRAMRILNSPSRRWTAAVAGIVITGGAFAGAALSAEGRLSEVSAKMVRQIGVMEKILDKVLIDSPNFLVRVGDNTRGLYIPGYGIVFTLDASLTGGMVPDLSRFMGLSDRFEFKTDEDGNQQIIIKKDRKDRNDRKKSEKDRAKSESDDDTPDTPETLETPDTPEPPEPPDHVFNFFKSGGKAGKDEAQLYAAGKDELIQAMLDYGDTMTTLHEGQNVVIAAFLRDSDYFKESKISRLVLRAKIDDLRRYGEGGLSDEQARSRIMVEEY